MSANKKSYVEKAKRGYLRSLVWSRKHIPPGLRLVVGLVLMVFGVFGFLPVIGFWMLPLGIGIAALDVKPLWQRIRGERHDEDENTKG